jgi:putative membrane protein
MKLIASSLVVLLVVGWTSSQGGDKIGLPLDSDFMIKAASCNNAEIQIAKLAGRRSDSAAVKEFAERIVTDHQHAFDKLAELFKNRKVGVTAGLEKSTKDELARLGELRGTEFDRAFLKHMVDEHKKAIAVFENQVKNGKDAAVTDHAKTMLPDLQKHLKRAEELVRTEGK